MNNSPIDVLTAGAIATITCFSGSFNASWTLSICDFSDNASTGQAATHCPHNKQFVSSKHFNSSGPTNLTPSILWNFIELVAVLVLHAATHLPHLTHLLLSKTIDLLLSSTYSDLSATTNGLWALAFVLITSFKNSQFSLLLHGPHLNSCSSKSSATLSFLASSTFSLSVLIPFHL